MAKHYQVKVSDGSIVWKRLTEKIKAEEALDGIYVIRTNVSSSDLGTSEGVSQRLCKQKSGGSIRLT